MSKVNSYPRFFLCALIVVSGFFVSAPLARAALVNINTAGVEDLDTLDGIGPAYAQRIVDYRTANGPFQAIEEIQNVKGIGEVTFSKIKNSITVGSITASSDTGSSQTTPTSSSNTNSSHYSAKPISAPVTTESKISLGAGRNRTGIVGGPLEFKAELDRPVSSRDKFLWNFGDGIVAGGEVVSHTYEYPGEYIVVLSGQLSEGDFISRVNVNILVPGLEITAADQRRIEIINNSRQETNLFGRAIISGDRYFIFPKDTIIGSGQRISFSSDVTGLDLATELDAKIVVLKEGALQKDIKKEIDRNRLMTVNKIKNQIVLLKQQISFLSSTSISVTQEASSSVATVLEQQNEPTNQTASVINGIEEGKHDGLFQKIKRFFFNPKQ